MQKCEISRDWGPILQLKIGGTKENCGGNITMLTESLRIALL